MRICVIFNPTARGDRAKRLVRALQQLGNACVLKPTSCAGEARALASTAVNEGFDTIAAVGGDGTVNEVLNGIGDAPDGFARARLAVLPAGTVNVFARELQVPLNFPKAWQVIQRGRELLIDLPQVEYSVDGRTERRYFAQMAGAGLDAQAIHLVSWDLKKRIGQMAYVVAGFRAAAAPSVKIQIASQEFSGVGELVLMGNGKFYGGHFPLFRAAELQDGMLDICVFPRVTWIAIARYIVSYGLRRVIGPKRERHFQTKHVELSAVEPLHFEVDGELAGVLPATFTLRKTALRVVVP